MQVDFGYFGPPEEHAEWTNSLGKRTGTYITPDNPSSEICGEVAAAFASASIALKATDPLYAGEQKSWLEDTVCPLLLSLVGGLGSATMSSSTQWPQGMCDMTVIACAEALISHARQMLEFGRKYQGTYMKSKVAGMKDHAKHYPSSGWHDEMAWGALWLHFATGVRLLPRLAAVLIANKQDSKPAG